MNTFHKLIPLLLLATSSQLAAQTTGERFYSAETYGIASGDVPMPGLGLVLELVDGASAAPKLRLFGGPAGQTALILVSASSDSSPALRGATRLIGTPTTTYEGSFDWNGYYEVPLEAPMETGTQFFAQGIHIGTLDLAGEHQALTQSSNGLAVQSVSPEVTQFSWDELLPHLPLQLDELPRNATLAARLQHYLNSAGDSTKISLHIEGSGGAGVNAVGQVEVQFLVQRTNENMYEVSIGADLAAKVGAEVAEGLEANAVAGYGAQRVFAFHSAHGAARGILGMQMALRYPNLTPAKWLTESGLLGDAEAKEAALRAGIELAQQGVEHAEALLRDVLMISEERASDRKANAWQALQSARQQLANARRGARLTWHIRVSQRTIQFGIAHANLIMRRALRVNGEIMLDLAKQQVEQQREALRSILAELARLPRIVSALAQLRGYTTDHFAGTELHKKVTGSVELGIPLPVKLATLGAGINAELQVQNSVRYVKPLVEGTQTIVVTREFEQKGTASAAALAGGEYSRSRTIKVVQTIFVDTNHEVHVTTSRSITRDACGRVWMGDEFSGMTASGMGVGRQRSLSLDRDLTIAEDFDVVSFLQGEGRDQLDDSEVGMTLQDRRVKTFECDCIVSVAGTGGGFKFDIEWTDQGRLLSRSQTIHEAMVQLLDGLDQLPDPELGTVSQF